MKRKVFCQLQVEGLHNWPTCHLGEVSYLKYPHRHVFHIKCVMDVSLNDREIEFIKRKHSVTSFLHKKYYDVDLRLHNFTGMSCEMIAEELIEMFNLSACEISEDGENGCIVESE